MYRGRIVVLPALAVLLASSLAAACTPAAEGNEAGPAVEQTTTPSLDVQDAPTTTAGTRVDLAAEVLRSLAPEEKIGQLLMPQVYGKADSVSGAQAALNLRAHGARTPSEIVARHHLGGVIYLEENIESAEQVRLLSRAMQGAAATDSGIGLLVAIDQEGGRVSRLSDEVTRFPPASDFSGEAHLVKEASYITGQQVQQQGINVVLAPVADVVDPTAASFIGNRSYGGDPDQVADMVAAAVDGLQQAGVAAAVKHWPGHGATSVDSHDFLPELDIDRALWDQRERLPFDRAIAEGVAIVLVGHLVLPQLDTTEAPATVSPQLIDGLLRGDLAFDGVVMTDALNMGAVSGIPQGELVVAAVLAGVDVILIPPSLEEATAALTGAVADGTITEERLDQSVLRVLRLKERLGLLPSPAS